MTCERAQAYGRVMKMIENLGPSKLQPSELDSIRETADQLLFTEDIDTAESALTDAIELAVRLTDSGRWIDETANQLVAELAACGPVELRPVAT
ncbi:MAG TPA: hypothetical protein VF752_04850 [Thermoleophilaceae bacterium]